MFGDSCPDGKSGWFGGFTSCQNATASDVPAGTSTAELFDGVVAVLDVPDVASGTVGKATVTVSNQRDATVRLSLLLSPQGQAAVVGGAQHFSDALVPPRPYAIEPGGSVVLDLPVRATSCGDTYDDPEPGLPAGGYEAGVTLSFSGSTSDEASPTPAPLVDPSPGPAFGPVEERGERGLRAPFRIT